MSSLAGQVKGSCKVEIQAAMGGLGCPGSRVPLPCYRGNRKCATSHPVRGRVTTRPLATSWGISDKP